SLASEASARTRYATTKLPFWRPLLAGRAAALPSAVRHNRMMGEVVFFGRGLDGRTASVERESPPTFVAQSKPTSRGRWDHGTYKRCSPAAGATPFGNPLSALGHWQASRVSNLRGAAYPSCIAVWRD